MAAHRGSFSKRKIGVVVLIVGSSLVAARGQMPPGGACSRDTFNDVEITATPDFGTFAPNVTVGLDTTVQLQGISESITTTATCGLTSAPLSFSWSLFFHLSGAAPAAVGKHDSRLRRAARWTAAVVLLPVLIS